MKKNLEEVFKSKKKTIKMVNKEVDKEEEFSMKKMK